VTGAVRLPPGEAGLRRACVIRLIAAVGAIAVLALAASPAGFGKTRLAQRTGDPVRHPAVAAAALQLVPLGKGPCGDLDVFQIIVNGRPGMKVC
jgi:hypothetical protein